ncbi:hypothetical protein U1Q18_011225 [Sarracenia purpurea var. burkii]
MAFSFFALAIFLFLTLDSDYTPPVSAASEGVQITYGSVIKLMHERTKFRLHSHDVPYGSGSGQQSVTGFPNVDDSNSYWIVRPVPDSYAKQGDTIKMGTIVRLQHMRTRKWLHSHLHASPISGNLEQCEQQPSSHCKTLIDRCSVATYEFIIPQGRAIAEGGREVVRVGTGRALLARRTAGGEVRRDDAGELRDGRVAEAHEAAMRRRWMVAVEVETDRAKGARVMSEEA